MHTEIAVALIGVAGVATQVVVSYLINRQSANDLRTNIAQEIEIIRNLRPGSDEAAKLERHVRNSIDDLIARDERRKQLTGIIWAFGPFTVVVLAVRVLGVWRDHGVSSDYLRAAVDGVYWLLMGVFLATAIQLVWQLCRLAYLSVRLWWLTRRNASLEKKTQALLGHIDEVNEFIDQNKDEIIEKVGMEAWDELLAIRKQYESDLGNTAPSDSN